jgi:hypothetical protein
MEKLSLKGLTILPIFKSKLEEKVWHILKKTFVSTKYEPEKYKYIQPEIERTYTPDFRTGRKKIYLEAKGKLDLETRKKMLWFRDSNPDIRVIFLFQNPDNKLTKKSKTTYSKWADDNGFEWLDFRKDWLNDYKKLITS